MAIILLDYLKLGYVAGVNVFKDPLELPRDVQINIHNWISEWDSDYVGMWRTNEKPDKNLREKCVRDMITFINQSRVNHQLQVLNSNEQNAIINIYNHMRELFYPSIERESSKPSTWFSEDPKSKYDLSEIDDPLELVLRERDKIIKLKWDDIFNKMDDAFNKNMSPPRK